MVQNQHDREADRHDRHAFEQHSRTARNSKDHTTLDQTAANVTGACEEMASAINELRGAKGPDGRVVLTSPENLTRIDGLRRYLRELNRHQGLGFSVRRKRITSTLVYDSPQSLAFFQCTFFAVI